MKLSVSAYRAHSSAHKKILSSSYQTQLNYGSTAASQSSNTSGGLMSVSDQKFLFLHLLILFSIIIIFIVLNCDIVITYLYYYVSYVQLTFLYLFYFKIYIYIIWNLIILVNTIIDLSIDRYYNVIFNL